MKSITRLLILTWLILVVVPSTTQAAEYQRHYVGAGDYSIDGDGSSITAICLDGPKRHAAPPGEFFYSCGGDGSMEVLRFDGVKTLERTFEQSVGGPNDGKWLVAEGLGSGTEVFFRPRVSEPGVTYTLRVKPGGGIIGQSMADVNAIKAQLPDLGTTGASLNELRQEVEARVGDPSQIDVFREFAYNFESQLPGQRPELARSGARSFVQAWQRLDKQRQVLKRMEIIPGELCNDFDSALIESGAEHRLPLMNALNRSANFAEQALTKAAFAHAEFSLSPKLLSELRSAGFHFSENFPTKVLEQVSELKRREDVLRSAFGSGSPVGDGFKDYVLLSLEMGADPAMVLANREAIGNLMFPKIAETPGAREIFELMQGQRFSQAQAGALRDVLGINLTESSPWLDKHLLLIEEDGELTANTTLGAHKIKTFAPEKQLKKLVADHPFVTVLTPPSPKLVGALRRSGVEVIRMFDDLSGSPRGPPKAPKLIFAISENSAIASALFEGQSLESISRAAKLAKAIPGSVLVTSVEETEAALRTVGADQECWIIYHGTDSIHFPEGDVGIEEFSDRAHPLSCSTWQLGTDTILPTTGKVEIEEIVSACGRAVHDFEAPISTGPAGRRDFAYLLHSQIEAPGGTGGTEPPSGGSKPPSGGNNPPGGNGPENGGGGYVFSPVDTGLFGFTYAIIHDSRTQTNEIKRLSFSLPQTNATETAVLEKK